MADGAPNWRRGPALGDMTPARTDQRFSRAERFTEISSLSENWMRLYAPEQGDHERNARADDDRPGRSFGDGQRRAVLASG
jgi:hypothetical protein